jgi:heptosyltransferase-2
MPAPATMPQRVLVKAVNWLGDLVMSQPALRAVREGYPNAHLAVLVKRELAGFFDGAGWIDEVIPYSIRRGPGGLADRLRLIAALRARRFDLAVVFPRSFESALWVACAGIPRRAGFVADGRGLLLTRKTAFSAVLQQQHQMHDYLYLVRDTLGLTAPTESGNVDIAERHSTRMRGWLAEHRQRPRGPLIALAVAAAYGPAKEWPETHYAAVIDAVSERYGGECVLVGAPAERRKCEGVLQRSRAGGIVAAGETSVGELVALLALCNGFAGNDSGSMHVAAACGIPTVGLYGSTNPARTAPVGPKTSVIYRPIECSPCLARTCRFGHYRCLTEIEPEAALGALRDLGALG